MTAEYKLHSSGGSSDVPDFVAIILGKTVRPGEVVRFDSFVNGRSAREIVWNMILYAEVPGDVGELSPDGVYTAPDRVVFPFGFILLASRGDLSGANSAVVVQVLSSES